MIVWMRKHARGMKKELEGAAASALATGSARALVAMAFLAVLREGFETAVFVLAVLQQSGGGGALPGVGVVLGIAVAVVVGWGIYKGGVRINLSKFFKITGLILVFVAAGLLATAAHTAHEAGWINSFQSEAVSLRWLVHPGTVTESLLTGMLGLRPAPTQIEAFAYLVYAIPMALFVLWPRGSRKARRSGAERSVGAAQNPV